MIKTVIFDLDDTLYREADYCRSGFSAVARYLAKNCADTTENAIFDALWSQFAAGNRVQVFNACLEKLSMPCCEETISELVAIYRNHMPVLHLPGESKAVLDELYRSYTLALLTDGFLPAQRYKVEALGIAHYFKCIIYTESLGREHWKPSVAGFEKVLADCATAASHSVYVADNAVKDFIGPNKLGMESIQLLIPGAIHGCPAPDASAEPRSVIPSLSFLPSLLATL